MDGAEIVRNPSTDHYLCYGCSEVLVHPMQDSCCGHRYCNACVEKLLQTKPPPACRDCNTVLGDFHHDKAAEKMPMFCLNKGCSWKGTLKTLKEHLENCRFRKLACNECGMLFSLPEIKIHRRSCSKLHRYNGACFKIVRSGVQEIHPDQKAMFNTTKTVVERIINGAKIDLKKAMEPIVKEDHQPCFMYHTDLIVNAPTNGVMLWKIPDFSARKREAFDGICPSICSGPFYTFDKGYKMCLRLYLDGDGEGTGSHMSLYVMVINGENDDQLQWPFRLKITLQLLNMESGEDVVTSVESDPILSVNTKVGFSKFVPLRFLGEKSDFTIDNDDMVFIKSHVVVI